jgi:hypothetical protein
MGLWVGRAGRSGPRSAVYDQYDQEVQEGAREEDSAQEVRPVSRAARHGSDPGDATAHVAGAQAAPGVLVW